MAHHYLHLSDFTSGPGEDPVQGPGDDEEGLHGPGDDLRQGHPVAAGLHDVAIAAEAVAEAALSVAKALPVPLDFVDGAGVEPPTDDVGDTVAIVGMMELSMLTLSTLLLLTVFLDSIMRRFVCLKITTRLM